MIVNTNDGEFESELKMRDMEMGVLYRVVSGGEIVIRYSRDVVVKLSKPYQDHLWSSASGSTVKVVRCKAGFTISLTQD